jgi:DNA-directed RNA polymerase beta subunit
MAPSAGVDGKITKIDTDYIHIQDNKGEEHKIGLFNNFPLNQENYITSTTHRYKVGDTVGKNSILTDTNFTKNGNLALGANVNVAYMP